MDKATQSSVGTKSTTGWFGHDSSGNPAKTKSSAIEIPSISLPKGGGAVKGIDEKFSVNAVNGTASLNIPIPVSQGRGFSPAVSITYSSGVGNGVFGLGWKLNLPSIKRKTDKGIPRYHDSIESDTFLLSEAEDLVPVLTESGDFDERFDGATGFSVRRYRPRIDGAFSKIERWLNPHTAEVKWRVISGDNTTTLFGWSSNSRISNPEDSTKIFEWLPEFSFDDKGNSIQYRYKQEDGGLVPDTLHNKNRRPHGKLSYTNAHLSEIRYGNRTPYEGFGKTPPKDQDYCFRNVFDYGIKVDYQANESKLWIEPGVWACRDDAFSDYRSGFEIRTNRLCRRVLLYHLFDSPDYNGLVKSLNLDYTETPVFSFLKTATLYGFNETTHAFNSIPPVEFIYQQHQWNTEIKSCAVADLVHAPAGLNDSRYQFTDLYNEGLSGILTEQADGWFYKHNLGCGEFARAIPVVPKPSFTGLGSGLQFADLDADGGKQLVSYQGVVPGFFELDDENRWKRYTTFNNLPGINFKDANTRMLDLDGDGKADVLITEENVFVSYSSNGREGFVQGSRTNKPLNDEEGPSIVFADDTQSIFLADMSGDGLTDIVRIRNGNVCYWPNLGYGRFGAKVSMDNAPQFDFEGSFNPSFIRLSDIDGSGTTDLIYLGKNKFSCWLNQSGNSFSEIPFEIEAFPAIDFQSEITVTDLLGNGVACIVWSSGLEKNGSSPLRYIDLMGSCKPHVLTSYKNNMGKEVTFEYAASTKFYLEDKKAGNPWITKLHFPVHVVTKVTTTDTWRGSSFSTQYDYHHGYYDHSEREFRGFGRVEQTDVESFGEFKKSNVSSPYITDDHTLYQPPIKTITWYHTGAFIRGTKILDQFKTEYFPAWATKNGYVSSGGFHENELPEPDLSNLKLSSLEWREALRSCKGMTLRQEIYELEVDDLLHVTNKRVKLFSASMHNCCISLVQPKGTNRHAVFQSTESEAITYNYELDLRPKSISPDPRIAHTLNLLVDEWGHVLQSLTIAYGRQMTFTDSSLAQGDIDIIRDAQSKVHIAYTENRFATVSPSVIQEFNKYRLPLQAEALTYELTGFPPFSGYATLKFFRDYRLSLVHQTAGTSLLPVDVCEYHKQPKPGPSKRIIEHVQHLFFKEDLTDALPLGEMSWHGLPYETYKLAFTEDLLTDILGSKLTGHRATLQNKSESGYRFASNQYWICSGVPGFKGSGNFYMPDKYKDPFGRETNVVFDSKYHIYLVSVTDPLGNASTVEKFDFRVLAPSQLKDINDNLSETCFDALGMPVAMVIKGKAATPGASESGDLLPANFNADPNKTDTLNFFTKPFSSSVAETLLTTTTTRFIYSFGKLDGVDKHPPCAAALIREKHVSQQGIFPTEIQTAFEYSDGSGTVLVKKIQAEPDPASASTAPRWIASGLTVLNNKGKPVKQFEPYFSAPAVGHYFEVPPEAGVTPLMYYDAAGRLIRTEMPDGTLSRVEFDNWHARTFDANDTVTESAWYAALNMPAPLPASPLSTFTSVQRAAWMAANHANTPAVTILDSLGREVINVSHNKSWIENPSTGDYFWNEEKYVTHTELDAEGKPLWIRDARGNHVMEYRVRTTTDIFPAYDIAGNLLFQHSMDAGDRWMINNAAGNPLFSWDENGKVEATGGVTGLVKRFYRSRYDELQRPLTKELSIEGGASDVVIEKFDYSNSQTNDKALNMLGQWKYHYDSAGKTEQVTFDFKGNLLNSRRTLTNQYDQSLIDWRNEIGMLENETFEKTSAYDALNRMIRLVNWHSPKTIAGIYEPLYNKRGLLKSEKLSICGNSTQAIVDVSYDVKGQRQDQKLGCNTVTHYDYDPQTFRLTRLYTSSPNTNGHLVQDLNYTYDPVGNIIEIEDRAIDPVFFNNQKVEAKSQYMYDALYRLTEAGGRENGLEKQAADRDLRPNLKGIFPDADPLALRNYTQKYFYDAVGNISFIRHNAGTGSQALRWTRQYFYHSDSNRLKRTEVGATGEDYHYDVHGSILNLGPTLADTTWSYDDMLRVVDLGNGHRAIYNYGSDKQRTRKRIERPDVKIIEDRIYLEGFELYRRSPLVGDAVEIIETHHLMNGSERVVMIENVRDTDNTHLTKGILHRYQYSNHLGTVGLELDAGAQIISYEEFHPYGTTAYQRQDPGVKCIAKRYKYTGMERDEETGLSYHTARYYVPWLGRWGSADPIGVNSGNNLYLYAAGRPIVELDGDGMQPRKPWLTKNLRPVDFSDEESVRFWVDFIHLEYGWPSQDEVRLCVDVGGQLVPGRADVLSHPPGMSHLLNANELKKANPYQTGSGAKFKPHQRWYIPAAQAGKEVNFPYAASNVSVKAGDSRVVQYNVIYPENITQYEAHVRMNTPGFESPGKATPPIVRRGNNNVNSIMAAFGIGGGTKVASIAKVLNVLPLVGRLYADYDTTQTGEMLSDVVKMQMLGIAHKNLQFKFSMEGINNLSIVKGLPFVINTESGELFGISLEGIVKNKTELNDLLIPMAGQGFKQRNGGFVWYSEGGESTTYWDLTHADDGNWYASGGTYSNGCCRQELVTP